MSNSTEIQNHGFDFGSLISQLGDTRMYERRTLFLSEAVMPSSAKPIISALLSLDADKPGEPIRLFLNSPGGEVNSGYAIHDVIKFIKSPVTIINAGLCASIATVINVGAKKGNRLSLPNSRFLIHQPLISGHVQGQASDLEITAQQILLTRAKINKLLSDETGTKLEQVEKDTVRDYWMDAEEAKAYGLIDKIITSVNEIE
jgi:ATP-dependent Clp protease, protease subunit